jgi:type I restriction enzyme M protein
VTLGDKLFYGTGLSPCFLVLRKVKPAEHSARILMIDGTKILTQKRAQNVLEPADVDRLYQLYKDYADVEDFSKVVTLEQVAEKEFNLSPNRYVEYHKEEIRPYEEVKAEFLSALAAVKEAEAQFQLIINE